MRSTPAEAKPPDDDEPDDEPQEPPPPADRAVVARIEARAQVYVCVPSCVPVNSVYRINLFSSQCPATRFWSEFRPNFGATEI